MKKILMIILILIVILVSGCVKLDKPPSTITKSSVTVYNCDFPFGDYDWESIASSSTSRNINQLSSSELWSLSSEILMAIQKWDHGVDDYTPGECENPPNKCREYRCKILDAVKKNDNSICQDLPKDVNVIFRCEDESKIKEDIENLFGISSSEYTLDSSECRYGRGSNIKAQGTFEDGKKFEIYYRWGWCSSGGTDCGFDACFSINSDTSDERFELIQDKVCNKLSSRSYNDGFICTGEVYDKTQEVKNACLAGDYNQVYGDKKVLSIKQISNRCSSKIETGETSCFGEGKTVAIKDICEAEVAYTNFETEDPNACELFETSANLDQRDKDVLKYRCYAHKAIRENDITYCDKIKIETPSHPSFGEAYYQSECKKDFAKRYNQ